MDISSSSSRCSARSASCGARSRSRRSSSATPSQGGARAVRALNHDPKTTKLEKRLAELEPRLRRAPTPRTCRPSACSSARRSIGASSEAPPRRDRPLGAPPGCTTSPTGRAASAASASARAGPISGPTAAHHRPADPRAAQRARHPAGLDRRVDLPGSRRAYPGHGARCARPQAVPLSPAYREARDQSKFRRMLEFSEALPALRERIERDLRAAT